MSSSTPANRSAAGSDDSERVGAPVLAALRRDIASGRAEGFSDAFVQELVAVATKVYFARVDQVDDPISPVASPNELAATEVLALVDGLLRAANLNQFDLRMWLSRRQNPNLER